MLPFKVQQAPFLAVCLHFPHLCRTVFPTKFLSPFHFLFSKLHPDAKLAFQNPFPTSKLEPKSQALPPAQKDPGPLPFHVSPSIGGRRAVRERDSTMSRSHSLSCLSPRRAAFPVLSSYRSNSALLSTHLGPLPASPVHPPVPKLLPCFPCLLQQHPTISPKVCLCQLRLLSQSTVDWVA